MTYRWHGHMEGETAQYRSAAELEQWKQRCPIATWRVSLIEGGRGHGMQLMDDALFIHWKNESVSVEDVLAKAHRPDDLAKRIVQTRKGLGDEQVPVPEE